MSQTPPPLPAVPPPSSSRASTRAAIAEGARATGTDFRYLMAQARLESGLDPRARAGTSSASGLFQFIDSTWLRTLDRHGAAHGLPHLADRIEQQGGRVVVSDPALREQILRLRHDPTIASVMAGALAQDNRAALLPVLGREPDAAELYLAHFLGSGGATRFLRTLHSDPHAEAAALLPEAAAANRAIFYDRGQPRSMGEVMAVLRGRMDRAMDADGEQGAPPATIATSAGGSWQPAPAFPIRGDVQSRHPARPSASMAQTLEESFGIADGTVGLPHPREGHVRAAYAKLKALAL